jgi:hypothetical protein
LNQILRRQTSRSHYGSKVPAVNSYKPITNTTWVRARVCKLQKRLHSTRSASDKVYQLLAHGRWFSSGTPASSTTKTGRHDIAESGGKHQKSINQSIIIIIIL